MIKLSLPFLTLILMPPAYVIMSAGRNLVRKYRRLSKARRFARTEPAPSGQTVWTAGNGNSAQPEGGSEQTGSEESEEEEDLNLPIPPSLDEARNLIIGSMCAAIIVMYTSLTYVSFDSFRCSQQADGSFTMDADPSINCYEDEWFVTHS